MGDTRDSYLSLCSNQFSLLSPTTLTTDISSHVPHHGINACLRFVRSLVLSPESSSPKSCLWFIRKELITLISMSKDIYTNRNFPGIDKSSVYQLKPSLGQCPMSGVPLVFPVHSWHQRKNEELGKG